MQWKEVEDHAICMEDAMLRMLRLPEVVDVTGKSPTTIWRDEKAGKFPRRRRIGPNAVGWRSDEIEQFIRRMPVVEGDTVGVGGADGDSDRNEEAEANMVGSVR